MAKKSFEQLYKEAKERERRKQGTHTRSSTQTTNVEDARRRFLPNLAQGSAAGLVGAPVDIMNAILDPLKLGSKRPVMGSEWIGEKLKSDIDSPAFTLGQFIDPLSTSASLAKLAPLALGGIIKRKGGNWYDNPMDLLGSRRFDTPEEGRRYFEGIADYNENYDTFVENFDRTQGINRWLDTTANKYVKNRMGTESDEIRKLADQGITHANLEPRIVPDSILKAKRRAYGMPEDNLAQTEQGKTWEILTDNMIYKNDAESYIPDENIYEVIRAMEDPTYQTVRGSVAEGIQKALANGDFDQEDIGPLLNSYKQQLRSSFGPESSYIPDLALKNPRADIYDIEKDALWDLRFDHIIDELDNAMLPDSGLPQNLRLTPEGLGGLSMEEAIKKVHGINLFRAEKAKKANARFAAAEGIPVYKEYPEGYRWLEYKMPDEADEIDNVEDLVKQYGPQYVEDLKHSQGKQKLESWLKQEGDTMGHCVGGYCDRVMSGDTRILSLRDNEGKSVATVQLLKETKPHVQDLINDNLIPQELMNELVKDYGSGSIGWSAKVAKDPRYQELLKTIPEKWSINQVKGAGNHKPPKEAMPFIQDFVKSSGLPVHGDLDYTDLIDMRELSGNFIDGYMNKDEAREAVRKLFEEKYPDQSPNSWYEAIDKSY